VMYEEVTYEGYGPGGTALLIEALTDNKNRTVAEIRHHLSRHNGTLGESGCVSWIFEKKGIIAVKAGGISEDELMELVLEAGAEDMTSDGEFFEIITSPTNFEELKRALAEKQIAMESAELTMHAKNTVKVGEKDAEHLLKLMDILEEHDDVNNVYSNFDIDPAILEKLSAAE